MQKLIRRAIENKVLFGPNLGSTVRLARVGLNHAASEFRASLYNKSDGKLDITLPHRFYGIVNERCNLKCQGCDYWRKKSYVDELPAAEWIRVLAEIKDLVGPFHINFSGGEPLVKRDLFEILGYCRDNDIFAGLTTNGVILRDSQASQLVESKLFSLNISIDGFLADTHDLQRGVKGSYKAVLRGIDLMKTHSAKTGIPVPIVIKPTLTNLNYHEMPNLTRFASEIGVKGILFQPVGDWGTSEISNLWIRDKDALRKVIDELVQLKHDGYPILNEEWQIRDLDTALYARAHAH